MLMHINTMVMSELSDEKLDPTRGFQPRPDPKPADIDLQGGLQRIWDWFGHVWSEKREMTSRH